MLVVDKNLNPKNVHGEKHRSPSFSLSAIFSIPFLILAIVTSASVPPREGRGVIIGLLIVVWMALPVALLIACRKTSYIIGEDKLYFFNSQINFLANEKRKEMRRVRTNGSVNYSDITEFRYLGIKFEMEYARRKYIVPPRVVIVGDDFEVEIYAYKGLINKLQKIISTKKDLK